jgi:uncharacterized protein YbbC (DUF1343 family)
MLRLSPPFSSSSRPPLLFLLACLLALCTAAPPPVITGAQRLFLSNFSQVNATSPQRQHHVTILQLSGKHVAVLSNPSGLLSDLTHIVDAMWRSGAVSIAALLGPEHGFR